MLASPLHLNPDTITITEYLYIPEKELTCLRYFYPDGSEGCHSGILQKTHDDDQQVQIIEESIRRIWIKYGHMNIRDITHNIGEHNYWKYDRQLTEDISTGKFILK